MRHINIPVFIPHLGCPNSCVFCNQKTISGTEEFRPETVAYIIEESLSTVCDGDDVEIAFFGGSFTGIDRELMVYLLDTAEKYVKSGKVSRIRCSTRPDYISEEILDILDRYTIGTVELGIQSMSDHVLMRSERGHTKKASERAVKLLLSRGYRVGGQMMAGLPGATLKDEIDCAEAIVRLGCSEARVYPTVVFADTKLCEMAMCGQYEPLTLDEAVERTAKVLGIFYENGIKVLRVGLCDSENLHSSKYFAGPNHPSIGELCESRIFLDSIVSELDSSGEKIKNAKKIILSVPCGKISQAVGQKRKNTEIIKEKYGLSDIKFRESDALFGHSVSVTFEE